MAKFIESGLVRQTDEYEFTVHGNQGDQKFKINDQQWLPKFSDHECRTKVSSVEIYEFI